MAAQAADAEVRAQDAESRAKGAEVRVKDAEAQAKRAEAQTVEVLQQLKSASVAQPSKSKIGEMMHHWTAAKAVKAFTSPTQGSSRSAYLLALHDVIGPAPTDRGWRDEWKALNLALAESSGFDVAATAPKLEPGGKFHYDTKLKTYAHQVEFKIRAGWHLEEALAHVALSGACSGILAESIAQGSSRFAASVHALYGALVHAAQLQEDTPPVCYQWIEGKGGLAGIEAKFRSLHVPDVNGFCGLTCAGEISCLGPTETFDLLEEVFPGDGMKPCRREMNAGVATYKEIEGDVVAFVSRPETERGLHSSVNTGAAGSYRIPPQSLVVLRKYHPAGTWKVENTDVRPACGCYECSVTYMLPQSAVKEQEDKVNIKYSVNVTALTFGDRQLYGRGRKELESDLPLTLAEEWLRGDDNWSARDGTVFSAAAEYLYVLGVAGQAPHGHADFPLQTFAGTRDHAWRGRTLDDFVDVANTYVRERAAEVGMTIDPELQLLTREEVIAVRLYTGPPFQVLNTFLREMAKLNDQMRMRFAHARDITYAATARALCGAIRKLSRVNPAVQGGLRRYRGVCGVLNESFFVKDAFGMISVTDCAFMSTSTGSATPLHYMSENRSNVLWELLASGEDERGFHCGADVSMLSQFAGEKEELYPPLTMLRVVARSERTLDGGNPECSLVHGANESKNAKSGKGSHWSQDLKRALARPRKAPKASSPNAKAFSGSWTQWELLLDSASEHLPVTAQARKSALALKKHATEGLNNFIDEFDAELKLVDGRSFVHILVEPTFV